MKEAIITSSILILCIALIRWLCRGRIRACLQYTLWLVVAIRLIMPGITWIFPNLLPESDLSILNVTNRIETVAQEYIPQPELPIQITFPLSGLPSLNGQSSDGPTSVFLAGKIGWMWTDFFHVIWCFGMIVAGIWMLVVNIKFSKKLHQNRTKILVQAQFDNKEYKLPVYLVEEISSPCLYGLPGRQAVYLPKELEVDEERRRHILAHEYCHYKHGDVFWSALRCILVVIYWFHPLVWLAAVLSRQDCELACDETAIRLLGEEERIAYGKTLISLITRQTKASDIACTATTMTAAAKGIKERISRIAEKPHRLVLALLLVVIAVAAVSVFTFTQAKDYPEGAYILEGESSLTVTTNCFQVTFPESFSGTAYYQTENGTDIIVFHQESKQEIGRFCMMPFEDAVALADQQEVVLIGEYGSNPALKSFVEDGVTEHTYYPYTAESVPATDIKETDEVTYIIEESMSDDTEEDLPYEESYEYLPSEEITVTTISSEMPCYFYVPAQYEEMDEGILIQLTTMNQELMALTDSIIVL